MAIDETVVPAKSAKRFVPSTGGWVGRGAVWAVLAWFVLCYPGNFLSPFEVRSLEADAATQAIVFAVIALSLNVLIGYAGQISLGHQAFVGFGSFTSAYVVTDLKQEFWIGLLVAAIVGALQAVVLGAVALRLSGLYFALITLSYGVMAEQSIFNIEAFTGGDAGKDAARPIGFESNYRYYYLCLAILAVVLWLDWRMMRTKGGRALLALRENPRVAASLGINVKAFTLLAFAVGGAFAGIGGSLLAHRDLTVVRNSFEFRLALVFVLMTVVGGLRSRSGVVLGAAFFALLGNGKLLDMLHLGWVFEEKIDLPIDFVPLVVGPLLLLLTLTMYPGGIGQQIAPVREWLLGKRFDRHAGKVKEVQITDVRA
ncbi:MAG: branched-chain amino acid transport system permease protein [Acidimicrobiaceae bacterium]|jgi:branched-chain amino acid transport system permease protein